MAAIKRRPDWRGRLIATVEARRATPMGGGYHCGILVADCICNMTDVDLAADYRACASMEEAIQKMHTNGFADLCALVAGSLAEIPVSAARVGDVLAFPSELMAGWALGVVIGERAAVLHPAGVGTVACDTASKAFRVP